MQDVRQFDWLSDDLDDGDEYDFPWWEPRAPKRAKALKAFLASYGR